MLTNIKVYFANVLKLFFHNTSSCRNWKNEWRTTRFFYSNKQFLLKNICSVRGYRKTYMARYAVNLSIAEKGSKNFVRGLDNANAVKLSREMYNSFIFLFERVLFKFALFSAFNNERQNFLRFKFFYFLSKESNFLFKASYYFRSFFKRLDEMTDLTYSVMPYVYAIFHKETVTNNTGLGFWALVLFFQRYNVLIWFFWDYLYLFICSIMLRIYASVHLLASKFYSFFIYSTGVFFYNLFAITYYSIVSCFLIWVFIFRFFFLRFASLYIENFKGSSAKHLSAKFYIYKNIRHKLIRQAVTYKSWVHNLLSMVDVDFENIIAKFESGSFKSSSLQNYYYNKGIVLLHLVFVYLFLVYYNIVNFFVHIFFFSYETNAPMVNFFSDENVTFYAEKRKFSRQISSMFLDSSENTQAVLYWKRAYLFLNKKSFSEFNIDAIWCFWQRRQNFFFITPSPWPFLISTLVAIFMSGFVLYFNYYVSSIYLYIGLLLTAFVFAFWCRDFIREVIFNQSYSALLLKNFKVGFWLFIVSEFMLFFSFFWGFYHSMFEVSIYLGVQWPPISGVNINSIKIPFMNTLLLVCSGLSLTAAQFGLVAGRLMVYRVSFFFTVFHAVCFLISQLNEYMIAFQQANDSVYGSTMYMLTAFHGMHVFIGLCFLTVCYIRAELGHLRANDILSFILAGWYWHFVDVVWIGVFLSVYVFGTWYPQTIVADLIIIS